MWIEEETTREAFSVFSRELGMKNLVRKCVSVSEMMLQVANILQMVHIYGNVASDI